MSNDGTAPEPGRQQPGTGEQPAAPAPSGYEASSSSGPAPSGYEATPSAPSAPSGSDAPTAAYPTSPSSDAPTAAYPTSPSSDAPTAAYPTTPTSAWPTAPGSGPAGTGPTGTGPTSSWSAGAGEGAPSPYAAPDPDRATGGADQAGAAYPQAGYPQAGGYPEGAGYPQGGAGYPQGGASAGAGYPAAGYPQQGGGYPGGGYPGGAQPYSPNQYQGPATGTDGVSVAALVTGILGTGVVAIVLGVLGLRRTKKNGTKGRGFAIAGLVLGGLGVIGWIVTAVLVTTAIGAYNNRLDDLHDACEAGSMQACDDLYDESAPGSEHEEFGATCGGRVETTDYCVGLDLSEGSGEDGAAGAQTYGDDPELDALWDACAAGDMAACDALYASSPSGSEYESFGETCGETTDGTLVCDSASDTSGDAGTSTGAQAYGDDPELDALWDACEAGSGTACSDLYWESEFGTEYESFGRTCGNRVEAALDCAAEIGA